MSIAFWCVFIAALLHFLTKLPLGKAQASCEGGYDNSAPRSQQASLSGWGQRALAAHQNQIESFPLFAAGVIIAQLGNAAGETVDMLAITFIAARILFAIAYLKDWSTLRSSAFIAGYFASLALICSPAWA